MKASELRLGNLIKIGGNTLETYQTYTPTKVTLAIMNEIAGENEERPDAELSVFQPILLTEEWLLKFGFEKIRMESSPYEDGEYTILSQMFTVYKKEPITHNSVHGWFINNHNQPKLNIKYVHQLQNLYYALTGEELQPSRLEKPGA